MHFGKQLKKYVYKNFRSYSEYARKIGVSPQVLNSYWQTENIRYRTLEKMAKAAEMSIIEFTAMLEKEE